MTSPGTGKCGGLGITGRSERGVRGRFPLGVVLIFGLLLGLSSLGLNQSPRETLAQFTLPATATQTPLASPTPPVTDTPTSTVEPTFTPISTSTSAPPSATTPPPGDQPTNTPKPRGAPATPSLGIKVNHCARVVRPDGLNLGQGPGLAFGHVQIVGLNGIVLVTDGPQRGDDLWWWKVITREGVAGWGINDHLSPYSGECFGSAATAPAAGASPAPASPTALPAKVAAVSTTAPGSQEQLPATGAGDGGLLFAGALATILLIVGLIRRRTQGTI